jgi:hypothetical protein
VACEAGGAKFGAALCGVEAIGVAEVLLGTTKVTVPASDGDGGLAGVAVGAIGGTEPVF